MKRYGFLLFLIIFLIVSCWNTGHLFYQQQLQKWEQEVEDYYSNLSVIPMVIFSEKAAGLKALKKTIINEEYIHSIEIETNTEVVEKLIEKYHLQEAELLKEKYSLPHVMTIFFDTSAFDAASKQRITQLILAMDENADINYNENLWQEIRGKTADLKNKIHFLQQILLPIQIGISLLFILFITFLWVNFANKNNSYWHVFRKAGGNPKLRNIKFYSLLTMLTLLPVLL
ncbi:MAG TPA: hypothetical protein DHM37_05355, partial [Candidatus Cloacimonas sp.]|nr:hypothetical protein [Candidatus Cloacimonas sp.]